MEYKRRPVEISDCIIKSNTSELIQSRTNIIFEFQKKLFERILYMGSTTAIGWYPDSDDIVLI